VRETQNLLDTFVSQVLSDKPLDKVAAPPTGYGIYEGISISILMRAVLKPCLDAQKTARERVQASVPALVFDNVLHTGLAPSKDPASNYDKFVLEKKKFTVYCAKLEEFLSQMNETVVTVDNDMAAYDRACLEFCHYPIGLLDGYDLFLDESMKVHQDSLARVATLELALRNTANPESTIPTAALVEALKAIHAIIQSGCSQSKQTRESLKCLAVSYKALAELFADICTPGRFNKDFGSDATNLSSLIAQVRRHVHSVNSWFEILQTSASLMFDARFEHKYAQIKSEMLQSVDNLFGELLPTIKNETKDFKELPKEIQMFFEKLQRVHSDVQSFFGAGFDIWSLCRAIETKAITAHQASISINEMNSDIRLLEATLKNAAVPTKGLNVKSLVVMQTQSSTTTLKQLDRSFDLSTLSRPIKELNDKFMAMKQTQPGKKTIQEDIKAFEDELSSFMQLLLVKEKMQDFLDPYMDGLNPVLTSNGDQALQKLSKQLEIGK
jgi:hypothetical protein